MLRGTVDGLHMFDESQNSGATQSFEVLHDVGHIGELPLQRKGSHAGMPGVPTRTGRHMPSVPESAQESQPPEHRLSQQKPSLQNVVRHSSPEVHWVPFMCRGVHMPWTQYMLAGHSEVPTQDVLPPPPTPPPATKPPPIPVPPPVPPTWTQTPLMHWKPLAQSPALLHE
jgi:hypothetical protein